VVRLTSASDDSAAEVLWRCTAAGYDSKWPESKSTGREFHESVGAAVVGEAAAFVSAAAAAAAAAVAAGS